jgi:methionyl-tRNA formyltransferase
LKALFFGAGTFGLETLEALVRSRHAIRGLVTPPARPSGRGLKAAETPLGRLGRAKGLPVFEIPDVNAAEGLRAVAAAGADVFVVVSFGTIFSRDFLRIPPRGTVNLHASLLPKYRGASPVAYALLAGERETGVTTLLLSERLDAGGILLQEKTAIGPDEDARGLGERLARLGAGLVVRTLDGLEAGRLEPRPQDERAATYAPKLKKEDGWIDWARPAEEIRNRVRAFAAWPGTRTRIGALEAAVVRCAVSPSRARGRPGEVLDPADPGGLLVATGEGALLIRELQPAGGRVMSHREFLNGHRVARGLVLGGSAP